MHKDPHYDAQPLFSFSFELPDEAFIGADQLTHGQESVWVQQDRGLIGYGRIVTFKAPATQRFSLLREQWLDAVGSLNKHLSSSASWTELPSGVGLVGFSSITFAEHSGSESIIVVPEIVVARRLCDNHASGFSQPGSNTTGNSQSWLNWVLPQTEAARLLGLQTLPAQLSVEDEALLQQGALQRWHELRASTGQEEKLSPRLSPGYVSDPQYLASVRMGLQLLQAQKAKKLVLSRDAVVTNPTPFAVAPLLKELARRYQHCWTYSVAAHDAAPRLLGSTPEMLIKVQKGHVSARLLAGTLDRAAASHDPVTMLLEDTKQRIEHRFAIDSLTAQLQGLVTTLKAPETPFLLELPNVWHLASDVSAELSPQARESGCAIMDLVERVHPTAAVCGTPTAAAAHLLHKLEGYDRSWYAGPVGWLDDAGNGEFGLALRGGILETPQQLRLYAGCGVVLGSDPEHELAETWAKLRPMLQALTLER